MLLAARKETIMMHPPGLRLRRQRERLGLSYRDVERASFQIAMNRGRPDFILRISRLADIENNNVVPTLYKLFSLAAIYPWGRKTSPFKAGYKPPLQWCLLLLDVRLQNTDGCAATTGSEI